MSYLMGERCKNECQSQLTDQHLSQKVTKELTIVKHRDYQDSYGLVLIEKSIQPVILVISNPMCLNSLQIFI